ncbi:hypothetical protein GCM10027055_22730 [Janibacter alkaliphilus]
MRARLSGAQGCAEPVSGGAYPVPVTRESAPETRPPSAVERLSAPAVRWIDSLPPAVPVVTVLAMLVVGVLVRPWGAVLLGLAGLGLLWLLLVVWRRVTPAERLMRVTVLLLVLALTLVTALPR